MPSALRVSKLLEKYILQRKAHYAILLMLEEGGRRVAS
jgi:hypothetical protein